MSDFNNSLLVNNESDEDSVAQALSFSSGRLLKSLSFSRSSSISSEHQQQNSPKRKSGNFTLF